MSRTKLATARNALVRQDDAILIGAAAFDRRTGTLKCSAPDGSQLVAVTPRTVPEAAGARINEVDRSGWVSLTGATKDRIGRVSPKVWAVSPTGQLFGPFAGETSQIADGAIEVRDRVHPLG
ncbi:hypothetical protein IEE94_08555 [Yimella sp. cx-573]|nr:hypothetical protein [Yimella sp. cx-573]